MAEDPKEALARYLVETYSDQLPQLAWSILGSVHDAQDICQEVLMKRLAHPGPFESRTHERAWLTRVTINLCKNLRRSLSRRPTVPLDSIAEQPAFQPEEGSLLAEVQQLPEQYRQVLVLYYYGVRHQRDRPAPVLPSRHRADQDEAGPGGPETEIGGIGR